MTHEEMHPLKVQVMRLHGACARCNARHGVLEVKDELYLTMKGWKQYGTVAALVADYPTLA